MTPTPPLFFSLTFFFLAGTGKYRAYVGFFASLSHGFSFFVSPGRSYMSKNILGSKLASRKAFFLFPSQKRIVFPKKGFFPPFSTPGN